MRVITLEYHDIVAGADFDASGFPGPAANSYKLSLQTFETHLGVLAARGEAGVDVRGARVAPRPPVVLTFDDGGASALDPTATALERHGFLGHFFITTERIGTPGFCSAEQLAALGSRGHIVGSHSHTHPIRMSALSDEDLRAEWRRSVNRLAEILGYPPEVASVPGGYYAPRIAHAAAAEGIRWLFTSEPVVRVEEVAGCRVLGRYTLRQRSAASEVASLAGRGSGGRARQWMLWNAKKAAKRLGGRVYLRLRAMAFGQRSGSERPGVHG